MGKRSPLNLLLLVPAAAFMAFGNGHATWWPATWLGLFFVVRFLRDQPFWRGLALAWPALLLAWVFAWAPVFRLQGIELGVAAVVLSLVSLLPFALDRLLAPRLPPMLAALVLPTTYVAYELAITTLLPYGTWGSIAYGQAPLLWFSRIAAVTGMWGVTFLVAWGASTANLVWEQRGRWRLTAAGAYAAVLAGVLVYGALQGGVRLAPDAPQALLVLPKRENNDNYRAELSAEIQDDLFAASAVVGQGPTWPRRFVIWPEDAFFITAAEEPGLLDRARRFTAAHGVYLQATYGLRETAGKLRYANTTVMVAPDGAIVWRYRKAFPVPGYEQKHMAPGDGRIAASDIGGARYAAAICFDGDHRQIMRQAVGSTTLFLPSDDWPAIVDLHAEMTRMRALEYGLEIVRPTINGRTAVFAPNGAARGVIDYAAKQRTARVALVGSSPPTLYARFGDGFAWACVAGLALLGLTAFARRQSRRP